MARDIPQLLEKQISAERIIEAGEVTDASGDTPADLMMKEELSPLKTGSVLNQEEMLKRDGRFVTVTAPGGQECFVRA